MPSISGSYNPAAGPLINIAIIPIEFALTQGSTGILPALPPDIQMFTALMDTGASSTCITQRVADEMKLVASGKTLMTGATGAKPVDQYAFGVGFLFNPRQAPNGQVSGDMNVRPVQGCVFENGNAGFEVLLGRDILCAGAFSLSFDGHYILSI